MPEDGVRTVDATVPDDWPPVPMQLESALLEVFSQHFIAQRDHVVQRAHKTIVEGHHYAEGRIHQRPFTALDELNLDVGAREKIVDIVAVFVDEAMEHCLRLIGSVTNTVGEYYTVTYALTAQLQKHEIPAKARYSLTTLHSEWRQGIENMIAADTENPSKSGEVEASHVTGEEETFAVVPIGEGEPLWFDYRKWLSKFNAFRRSARPTR